MTKLLPEPCIIAMDNTPYHSMLLNNYSKSNTRKTYEQDLLKNQDIDFSPHEALVELRKKVNFHKH